MARGLVTIRPIYLSQPLIGALHDRIRHLESICQVQQRSHAITPDLFHSYVSPQKESPSWDCNDQSQLLVIGDSDDVEKRGPSEEVLDPALLSANAGIHMPMEKSPIDDESSTHESPVNAMGTTSVGYHHTQADSQGFYGQSSAASFFNQVQVAFQRRTGKNIYHLFPPSTLSQGRIAKQPLSQEFETDSFEDCALPPRNIADKLLDLYRRRIYGLYPFVHWQTLLDGYQRLWNPESDSFDSLAGVGLGSSDCPLPILYSALNVMLALGLQFSDEPFSKREAMSKVFFRRARRLSQIDILDQGNLALVQALLIYAQYLQSTNLPNRCWNVVGLACRAAQALGLHLQEGDESRSQLALEIRRRTWHGCVLLDTVLSMTLGRPAALSYKSSVPLPSSIDDEYLIPGRSNYEQPENLFPRTAFYVQTLTLNKILSEVLSRVYNSWNETGKSDQGASHEKMSNEMIQIIVELDTKLVMFEQELPPIFRWDEIDPRELRPESIIQLQRNVLGERFFLIRCLLYRPVFASLCHKQNLEPHSDKAATNTLKSSVDLNLAFVHNGSIICIEAAQHLIQLVHMTADALGTETGAWWYNLYYTFTSAAVLILSNLCPSVRSMVDNESFMRSWQQCQDIMILMCSHNPTARELVRVLLKMQTILQVDNLTQDFPDPRSNKFSNSLDLDDRESGQQSISYLPELDLNLDGSFRMEDCGTMDLLWKDNWTFTSGQPMPWEG
ncbi:fungal-specific transcription factor domain-containing protein [Xylogone sp. PMI_703]|nr:fungal-specific transcription factor domain-containing protein [Xylogone sp. PMI_703]